MELIPYSSEHCREAFTSIMRWAANYGADLADAYMATTRLTEYCAVAYNGVSIYGVFLPDYQAFSHDVFKFHGVVTPDGERHRRNHRRMIYEYCLLLFEKGIRKITTDIPSFTRLNASHLKALGFTHEGTMRREWELDGEFHDLHRYGLFKDELEAPNGQKTQVSAAASTAADAD